MKKRFLSAVLCLCMVLTLIPVTAFAAEEDILHITTAEELAQLAQEVNAGDNKAGKTYILENDIDLSAYDKWTPIGDTQDHSFKGIFDGQGHTITGLKINGTTDNNQGLFGCISGEGTEVTRLAVKDAELTSDSSKVGAIAGECRDGAKITECAMLGGQISGDWSNKGGIAGYAAAGATVENCYSTGSVSGREKVGGIVGGGYNMTVKNCYVTGTISGNNNTYSDSFKFGDIVGWAQGGTVENCVALSEGIKLDRTKGIKRIVNDAGNLNMVNNYAWSGMTLNGAIVTDCAADNENGAQLLAATGIFSTLSRLK